MRVEDWFLSAAERGNPHSGLDRRRGDGLAWTTGNDVQPLIDGHAYFAALVPAISAMHAGDLLMFTDWRGDPDERLDGPGTGISPVLCQAAHRGVATFRERWNDPSLLSRNPLHRIRDMLAREDTTADPLPPQLPDPAGPGQARGPGAAHLSVPAKRLSVRAARRAERGARLLQGGRAGPDADLPGGPVPLVIAGHHMLRRRVAGQPRAPPDRGGAALPGPGRSDLPHAATVRPGPRAVDAAGSRRRPGGRLQAPKTTPRFRSTYTRRCASSTTSGRPWARTT